MAVTVLIWRGAHDTIACVECLLQLDQDVGIYLLDNASPDDSVERFQAWAAERLPMINAARRSAGRAQADFREAGPSDHTSGATDECTAHVTLIQTGRNLGYAGGNNVGIRHALAAGYDYVWVLNNDTEVQPDAVTWLLQRMEADPQIGICGSTLIYFDRRHLVQNLGGGSFSRFKGRGVPLGFQQPVHAPVDPDRIESQLCYVSGAAAMVSRRFLEEVGLMQEDYFLYWEELDWSMRARGKFKLGYAPRSIVYHKVGATIGTGDFGENSASAEFYMNRNRLRVCLRYSKRSIPFVCADIARSMVRWLLRGRADRAAVIARAVFGLSYVER